jgi:16S rRNA (guanine1516-N2)-methyltransferase
MKNSLCIAVTYSHPDLRLSAEVLAKKLNLICLEHPEAAYPYLLCFTNTHLELQVIKGESLGGPLFVDFLKGPVAYRRVHGGGRKELLAKAVGVKPQNNLLVLDATAGLGRDGFVLASLGCRVQCIERSAIIAALLQDGIDRLKLSDIIELSLIVADANDYMRNLSENKYPDVVYLDPMYPVRTKSALVKKELRILRDMVGEDQDASQLLHSALLIAKKRVVVKRPLLAPLLDNAIKPSVVYQGKTSRFDVYLTNRSSINQ